MTFLFGLPVPSPIKVHCIVWKICQHLFRPFLELCSAPLKPVIPVSKWPNEVREEFVEVGIWSCDKPHLGLERTQHSSGKSSKCVRIEVFNQLHRSHGINLRDAGSLQES